LTSFILPAGTAQSAQAHWVRAICRRAERLIVALEQRSGGLGDDSAAESIAGKNLRISIIYLNRLSDWLFLFARQLNHWQGQPDEPWPG
jgi:cob(I)alamin adenosyltransferase